jgi:DNA-binding NarL/FixJ family response regulator
LLKDCAQDDLAQAVRAVNGNLTFFSAGIADSVIKQYLQPSPGVDQRAPDSLSPREREVLRLLADGASAKEIAKNLDLSIKTVESHRQHIMQKLDIQSIAQLTKYAIRTGLTKLEMDART